MEETKKTVERLGLNVVHCQRFERFIYISSTVNAFMISLQLTFLPTSIAITDVVLLAYTMIHAQPRTREH